MSNTTASQAKIKVLFVCMGNICRSPIAEGVFTRIVQEARLTEQIEIDSAGTHAYHVGEPPDQRAQATAKSKGVDLSAQRARKLTAEDGEYFDYILVMDRDNLAGAKATFASDMRDKPRLMLDFATHHKNHEVPDPYYGGQRGFEQVIDMIEDAASGLLDHIRAKHNL